MTRLAALVAELCTTHPPTSELWLDIAGTIVLVRSSSAELRTRLGDYFSDVVARPRPRAEVCVTLIEAPAPPVSLQLRDWPREPGKRGRKEVFADATDGRLVAKLRTGMHFVLTARERLAVGPCIENLNQAVNFIIAQYLERCLADGWLLCHAAAVALGSEGLAIAARSGSGKSTLALHLMSAGLSFTSNDRLLIRPRAEGCELLGVPKMPRVNPGTLLHNRALTGLLAPERRAALGGLPARQLWQLEEKHDVMIRDVFGDDRTRYRVPLRALVVLNWSVDASTPVRCSPVDLASRRDLLERVMKSPGVFHRQGGGHAAPEARPEPGAYLRALRDVLVYEMTGQADFDVAVGLCRRLLER